jgi:Acetoacetate decarboxylase (ADC)
VIPLRQRRLAGRHGLVDGIPFEMPVNSSDSPALMAAFGIDATAAARLLPGEEIHPLRIPGGRSVLLVTVIDYRHTDIGRYIEFSIAIACTRGPRPVPPFVGTVFRRLCGTGQFVVDLPVSTEVSVKGGKGIWGMPKHQANLDFEITDDTVSSTYDLDGRFCAKIEIDRPRALRGLPLRAGAVNYCAFRGLLMKSSIYVSARADVALGRRAGARFLLGDHPRMDPLRTLDISSRPLFTMYLPDSDGVLDDHFEGWMLTSPEPPREVPDGLETVVDLSRSEAWLPPPRRRPGRAV